MVVLGADTLVHLAPNKSRPKVNLTNKRSNEKWPKKKQPSNIRVGIAGDALCVYVPIVEENSTEICVIVCCFMHHVFVWPMNFTVRTLLTYSDTDTPTRMGAKEKKRKKLRNHKFL